jgi:hypothetical protein
MAPAPFDDGVLAGAAGMSVLTFGVMDGAVVRDRCRDGGHYGGKGHDLSSAEPDTVVGHHHAAPNPRIATIVLL